MNPETAWTNRTESDSERGEIEIKDIRDGFAVYHYCDFRNCVAVPEKIYKVGFSSKKWGLEIGLCKDHADDDTAFELFQEQMWEEA